MRTNKTTFEQIKIYEGLKLKAYYCPAGVLTIGYGHTNDSKYPVYRNQKITPEQAEQFLIHDVEEAEKIVEMAVKVPLNDNQFSALVCFVFNIGRLKGTTLLRKLNAGDYKGAAEEFKKWNKAVVIGVKKELPGLVARRAFEYTMFLKGEK